MSIEPNFIEQFATFKTCQFLTNFVESNIIPI